MFFFKYLFLFHLISCSDNGVNENVFNYTRNNEESRRKLQNDDYEEINIHLDIGHLNFIKKTYDGVLEQAPVIEEITFLINFLETFPNIIKKLIKIKKNNNKNKIIISNEILKSLTDRDFQFEDNYLGKSFENDLVIFIGLNSLKEVFDELDIIHYDDKDKRPTIGYIKYNYQFISKITDRSHKNRILNILFLHEITHILGFKKSILFENGLLKTTDIEIGREKKYKKNVIANEKIIELARNYFNCSKIDYIELDENSVGDNEFIHWEGRILLGDYMTSEIYYPEQVISEFTIAVLESLGWYKFNNYTGGLMKFGRNKGCDFLEKDCAESKGNTVNSKFLNEFCSSDSFGTCSIGRQSRGYCFSSGSGSEARKRGYIRNGWSTYGKDSVEFCPVSIETINSDNNYYKGSCSIGSSDFGEDFIGIYQSYNDYPGIFDESF